MDIHTFQYVGGRWSVPEFPRTSSTQTLVLVFASPRFDQDPGPIRALCAHYRDSYVMGCSTAGEILGNEVFDDTIVVAVVQFSHTRLQRASARVETAEDSILAGRSIAKSLIAPDLRAVMVLSDGSRVNGSHLVAGLNEVLPLEVIITGGLAGDGTAFGKTWVIEDEEPREGVVAAMGLYGDRLKIGYGSQGGWDFFGPERVITRSRDHVLYELDGRPALDLYKEYLGERVAELPASALRFPLSIRAHRGDGNRVVRTVLSVDEQNKSMTFAGNVPAGHLAQLMRANFDRLVDGAAGASNALRKTFGDGTPALCIAVSCVGRRLVLGERIEEEVEAVLEAFDVPPLQIGFYSYGELSPYASGRCDLHNQTMTLTAFGEG